ncbi:hypothetical protein RHMOL_Rhmol06G0259200 [Rhododendron molle]|uniref:Uncharacterized protein n=1 Tax=Rhododendron molle TaxID=49168 RepID=A0ACC0NID2_RHOML|nr:hypothetical protein RHMOL_Rhmol06G0259200 [Rhododendron molle]
MNIEEGKERGVTSGNSPQPGVANYPLQSVIGFHQPISPSAPPLPPQFYAHGDQASQTAPPLPPQSYAHGYQAGQAAPPVPPQFYAHGYQAGQGYPVSEGIPTEKVYVPLPCCGIGIGWLLFILGFFLGVIPWYVGAIMLLCVEDYDKREKLGFIACAIIGVIATILIVVAVAIFHLNSN